MFHDFRQTAWDVMCIDDAACVRLLEPFGTAGVVALVEGELSVAEAVAYAHTLLELGLEAQAEELFDAVLAEVLRLPAQGGQALAAPWGAPQGLQ